jgi:hypothetical protein
LSWSLSLQRWKSRTAFEILASGSYLTLFKSLSRCRHSFLIKPRLRHIWCRGIDIERHKLLDTPTSKPTIFKNQRFSAFTCEQTPYYFLRYIVVFVIRWFIWGVSLIVFIGLNRIIILKIFKFAITILSRSDATKHWTKNMFRHVLSSRLSFLQFLFWQFFHFIFLILQWI